VKPLSIFIVEDHHFFRTGLAQWLNQQAEMCCCGEAASVREARASIAAAKPDVVLMDLRLGDGEGLDLIQELNQEWPGMRIIALSQFDEEIFAHRALQAGARGYLMKSEATDSVTDAIRTVMDGGIHLSPRMSAKLLQNIFPDPASKSPNMAKLTNRELQVFQLLGSGMSTMLIAQHLKLSHKTIETYRENLKVKLDLRDAAELINAAKNWVERGTLGA
jgi:DNA-binding NarL/FixJ family response regulator